MLVRYKISFLLPLIGILCACAGADTRYPSLAMRPFETAPPAAPRPAGVMPGPPVADGAAISALLNRAVSAHSGFTRQEPEAARLVRSAAGQSIESNSRAAALVAMADLAAQRGATSTALAELDELAVAAAITFAPQQEIEIARAQVLAIVADQDAAMTRLWEIMGQ